MLSRDDFVSAFSLRPGLNWIHVVSSDGQSSGGDYSTSDGVTNPEDREFLFAMRAECDAIFVSATTAIAEGYRASKLAPIFIIDRGESPKAAALAATAAADKHPIYLVKSIEDALAYLPDGTSSNILLESGRKMTESILADGNAPVGITQALVSVITQDSEHAARVATELLNQIGAKAVHDCQMRGDNVYYAFALAQDSD